VTCVANFCIAALALVWVSACDEPPSTPASSETATPISIADAEAIYDYTYPLVIMKLSQDVMFTVPFRARSVPNHFIHFKQLALPENKAVVLGNRNTLYSVGWVDLGKGPVVFEIPDRPRSAKVFVGKHGLAGNPAGRL